jgi:DNA-binding GntR family transcriptional regulator
MSRVKLFEEIRRESGQGASIRSLADSHGVHRRTVRQAIGDLQEVGMIRRPRTRRGEGRFEQRPPQRRRSLPSETLRERFPSEDHTVISSPV